jgi:predicted permease
MGVLWRVHGIFVCISGAGGVVTRTEENIKRNGSQTLRMLPESKKSPSIAPTLCMWH